MVEIVYRTVANVEWANTIACRVISRINGNAQTRRETVSSRICPEIIVEGMVLLHQDDDMPDRRDWYMVDYLGRSARFSKQPEKGKTEACEEEK